LLVCDLTFVSALIQICQRRFAESRAQGGLSLERSGSQFLDRKPIYHPLYYLFESIESFVLISTPCLSADQNLFRSRNAQVQRSLGAQPLPNPSRSSLGRCRYVRTIFCFPLLPLDERLHRAEPFLAPLPSSFLSCPSRSVDRVREQVVPEPEREETAGDGRVCVERGRYVVQTFGENEARREKTTRKGLRDLYAR
jgi:hypothetical protein